MKNRESVSVLGRPRDVGNAREIATSGAIEKISHKAVPMNRPPYDPLNAANEQDRQKLNYGAYKFVHTTPVMPGGRDIAGYKETRYRSDTAVFKEGTKVVKRDQAIGKVIIKSNHPNKDINDIYGK